MSSFENPKLNESFRSMSVTRMSSAKESESRVASSRPPKPAPRITTCFFTGKQTITQKRASSGGQTGHLLPELDGPQHADRRRRQPRPRLIERERRASIARPLVALLADG